MASIGLIGSLSSSTLIADLRMRLSLCSFVERTTPGESRRTMFLSSCTSYIDFVTPGVLPVGAALDLLSELIRLLFPTFGKPTTPTYIVYFMFPCPSILA